MSLNDTLAGHDLPHDFNVVIEIPANSDPVKYEIDKETGALCVDRFIGTGMRYPANYGYIPRTLCDDGDPLDVLLITPFPLIHGCVARARAVGVLKMNDESGGDAKLIAVPIIKHLPLFSHIQDIQDVPEQLREQIQHFFEHYKDLEKGKWVKIEGWGDAAAARDEILACRDHYNRV